MKQNDEDAALAAIKQVHASGGRQLTKSEVIEFIIRPMYYGFPKVEKRKKGQRGRPSTKTQYDLAYERRKDIYRRLVKLPRLRAGICTHDHLAIQKMAELLRSKKVCRGLAVVIRRQLEREGRPAPDISTIRKIIKQR